MRRSMFYDEHNGVWRTADGYGFGIIDDGLYPGEYRHRLKICSEAKYREFDLINFCRDFVKQFGVAPNTLRATEAGIKAAFINRFNEAEKTFEIGEFKMQVKFLDPECRDNILEILFCA